MLYDLIISFGSPYSRGVAGGAAGVAGEAGDIGVLGAAAASASISKSACNRKSLLVCKASLIK